MVTIYDDRIRDWCNRYDVNPNYLCEYATLGKNLLGLCTFKREGDERMALIQISEKLRNMSITSEAV